jgi:hypothetical protein
MNIGEMQRKLSLWAEQDKGRKFYGLFDLILQTANRCKCSQQPVDAVHRLSQRKDGDGPTEGEPDAVKVARPVRRGESEDLP